MGIKIEDLEGILYSGNLLLKSLTKYGNITSPHNIFGYNKTLTKGPKY